MGCNQKETSILQQKRYIGQCYFAIGSPSSSCRATISSENRASPYSWRHSCSWGSWAPLIDVIALIMRRHDSVTLVQRPDMLLGLHAVLLRNAGLRGPSKRSPYP